MPFDPGLAERLNDIVEGEPDMREQKMFGGIGWMLNGNMCVGVYKDFLILRVGEHEAATLFKEPHVKPMDITGKPMKGWAMVAPEGHGDDRHMARYVAAAIGFVRTLPAKS